MEAEVKSEPRFEVGWVVSTVKPSQGSVETVHYRILGVYKNLSGYWYAVEETLGPNVGDQVGIADTGAFKLYWKPAQP